MINRLSLFLLLMLACRFIVSSQSFRIEDISSAFGKGKPLKLSGGFSSNSTYSFDNGSQGRVPFVYFLNGHINLNIYGHLDLPFSFNLTNSGSSYKMPSIPNRLSIHPSYKFMTAHIGDVSMTFSPYTLGGHMFTGVGLELKPDGLDLAIMYGRLLRAVEYDIEQPSLLPTYNRMAYGFKVGRTGENYQVSINVLKAKDAVNSLSIAPDSLGVTPADNLSGSFSFLFKPVKFIELSGEYGVSQLTSDSRVEKDLENPPNTPFGMGNITTSCYRAFKANLNYVGASSRLGVGYERIDPNYRTLGAYYFASDIENITINASQSLFSNKANINLSLGLEHDDLSRTKATGSSRVVGSSSLSFSPGERLSLSLSYTSFQTYSNVRSTFESINMENPLDKLDSLSFVQLSQSANLNLNLITKKTEDHLHNLNMNISYQDAANKQGGIYRPGSVTEMINISASYSMSFVKSGLTLNSALNLNNSKITNGNTTTWGPTLGLNSRFLKKKALLGASFSYNNSYHEGAKLNEVFLCRINSSYSPHQHHGITLSYDFQWRSLTGRTAVNSSLLTAGYSYNF